MPKIRKLAEALIASAEKWADVRERNAAYSARNGMLGPTAVAKEQAAHERYLLARDALREALQ